MSGNARPFRFVWHSAVFSTEGPGGVAKRAVAGALFEFMDDEGKCWPSLAKIAAKAGCSRSTALEAINELVREGWLRRKSGDSKRSNRYQARLPKEQQVDREPVYPAPEEVDREPDRGSPGAGLGVDREAVSNRPVELASRTGQESLSKPTGGETTSRARGDVAVAEEVDHSSYKISEGVKGSGGDIAPWHELRRRVEEA